jgi:GNAT superfamily N-acetyltransferase
MGRCFGFNRQIVYSHAMPPRVRPALPSDADQLLRLIDDLNRHVQSPTGRMTRDILMRDAFGPDPEFEIAVADVDGAVVGYAAWCDTYETEHARAGLYMIDLYVDPAQRRHGLARKLVAAVAAECRRRGRGFVWWTAWPPNSEAAGFYADLGTETEVMIVHALTGDRFETLAEEGS